MLNVFKTVTITMSEDDVKEVVADYIRRKGYNVTANDVTLSVGTKWVGYGMDEHQVTYFKECTAVIKEE